MQHQAASREEQRQQSETARKLAEQQASVLQERVVALEARLQVRPWNSKFIISMQDMVGVEKCWAKDLTSRICCTQ